jgi:uncharacterized protein (TIGR03118 family)
VTFRAHAELYDPFEPGENLRISCWEIFVRSKENFMQRRGFVSIATLGLALVLSSSTALAQYQITNLVSNQIGHAQHIDPIDVNAWGLARLATSPWWVGDNLSGWSTLYNASGVKQGLEVEIPPAPNSGPIGLPTGVVANPSSGGEFQVQSWPTIFIFATLDGTISAWAPGISLFDAQIAVDNSGSKASYTALAVTNKASGNLLFAADNANNKVDIYDGSFTHKGTFASDPAIPSGFAVFGIRDINGKVFVSFANSSGGAGGFVDIYKEDGTLIGLFSKAAQLNQPWGFAVAPANFGRLSNTLLVSNNTNSGLINGFDAKGNFVGTMKDASGKVISIDQLWAIDFGGGNATNGATNKLFFTAGPHNNLAGTFGSIVAVK